MKPSITRSRKNTFRDGNRGVRRISLTQDLYQENINNMTCHYVHRFILTSIQMKYREGCVCVLFKYVSFKVVPCHQLANCQIIYEPTINILRHIRPVILTKCHYNDICTHSYSCLLLET